VFEEEVKFTNCKFGEANFSNTRFIGKTYFTEVVFNNQPKVFFDVDNLAKVSFMNTDITRIRFSDRIRWSGNDGFKIIDEELIKNSPDKKDLENLISIYRNLRKNYELRFRYEEANNFFAREVELKKMYDEDEKSEFSDSELMSKKLADLTRENNELKEKVKELKKLS